MFYENLKKLCESRNTTPTAVMKTFGFSTSMLTNWKNGGMPRGDTLLLFAQYFGVTTDYLLTGNAPVTTPTVSPDEWEILTSYRSHPELQAAVRKLLDIPESSAQEDAAS
jgi:transcriptional regulator with XRE-family HTH domain